MCLLFFARALLMLPAMRMVGRVARRSTILCLRPLCLALRSTPLSPRGWRLRWSSHRHHWHAINQELRSRNDHVVARIESRNDGVVVPYGVAEHDRRPVRHRHSILLQHHEHETLLALPRHRKHRNHCHRLGAPDDSGLHQLRVAKHLGLRLHRSLHQNSLKSAVHFSRNEIDPRLLQQLAIVVCQIHRQTLLAPRRLAPWEYRYTPRDDCFRRSW